MRYLVLLFASQLLLAQQPRIDNAKMESRAAGNLDATLKSIVAAQESPAWVGYSVPSIPGNHDSCCWSDSSRGCSLEGRGTVQRAASGPVMLEGSSTLIVLLRIANHAIDKMRTVSGNCELDAGGLLFINLTGVRPSDSVAFLEAQVTENKSNQAIVAIAMHGDPAADSTIKRLALSSPSESIRDKTMFALTLRPSPDAVNTLIEAAKSDKSPKVRRQALFWLAHKAGQKEVAAIGNSIDNDPDISVKKKAVFAISQLPREEGVPKLIEIARTNKTPEVRKQAMFWLGQSKDPRALTFFQDVLK